MPCTNNGQYLRERTRTAIEKWQFSMDNSEKKANINKGAQVTEPKNGIAALGTGN